MELVMKFSAHFGILGLFIMLTRVYYWTLSQVSWNQCTVSFHKLHFNISHPFVYTFKINYQHNCYYCEDLVHAIKLPHHHHLFSIITLPSDIIRLFSVLYLISDFEGLQVLDSLGPAVESLFILLSLTFSPF